MTTTFRAMNAHDIESCYAMTQQLKWPHRREDWQQALAFGETLRHMKPNAQVLVPEYQRTLEI